MRRGANTQGSKKLPVCHRVKFQVANVSPDINVIQTLRFYLIHHFLPVFSQRKPVYQVNLYFQRKKPSRLQHSAACQAAEAHNVQLLTFEKTSTDLVCLSNIARIYR